MFYLLLAIYLSLRLLFSFFCHHRHHHLPPLPPLLSLNYNFSVPKFEREKKSKTGRRVVFDVAIFMVFSGRVK